jgi:hypothetical protein
MAMTYPEWANLCLTDVRKWFEDGGKDFESMLPMLYNMGTADGQEEYDVTYSGLGKFELLTSVASQDKLTEEYKTTYTFPEFMKEIQIQRRLWDDRRDRSVMNMTRELRLSADRTKEAHGGELFNYAFTATGTFSGGGSTAHADGKALCAADHPSKADAGYAGDNLGSSAISATAVSDTRDAMRAFTDGRGNKIYGRMDMILGPADKDFEEVAWEIINTTGKVDTADNNSNFHKGRYKLAIWQELTDTENWFGIDSARAKVDGPVWLNRVPLETYDSYSDNPPQLSFGGYMRYGFQAPSWRWIYGHNVA